MNSKNIFLAEGVFAVIEVKSNLTRAKLKEAGSSLDAVKNLEANFGAAITSGPTIDRPLRIIFAYEGATWNTLLDEIQKRTWRNLFDLICIVQRGVLLRKGLLLDRPSV